MPKANARFEGIRPTARLLNASHRPGYIVRELEVSKTIVMKVQRQIQLETGSSYPGWGRTSPLEPISSNKTGHRLKPRGQQRIDRLPVLTWILWITLFGRKWSGRSIAMSLLWWHFKKPSKILERRGRGAYHKHRDFHMHLISLSKFWFISILFLYHAYACMLMLIGIVMLYHKLG